MYMNLLMKRVLFWGIFLIGIYLIGRPYRDGGADIGLGFAISLIGLGTVLYFISKKIFRKELGE